MTLFHHHTLHTLVQNPHRFCVAPMMGYSHQHFIAFMRLITRHGLLFTEMLPADAVCVNPKRMCSWRCQDFPIAVQLGGSNAAKLARAAKIIADYGASEINLNMGCPSPRVQKGAFGASLMCQPQQSAELVASMVDAVDMAVSVKLRIGVDAQDSEEELHHLIALLRDAGASAIYLHARKAWLSGLNPKQNREIPPLRYDVVSRVKQQFHDLPIILNGGIVSIEGAVQYCESFNGVMVGRAAVRNPLAFAGVDGEIFLQKTPPVKREAVFLTYLDYIDNTLGQDNRGSERYVQKSLRNFLLQPLFAMAYASRGAKQWRRDINAVMRGEKSLDFLANMTSDLARIESQESCYAEV